MKFPLMKRDDQRGVAASPFERSMSRLQRSVNRLLDDARFGRSSWGEGLLEQAMADAWFPKADVSETERAYKIRLSIPGVKPDEVEVEVDGRTLTVTGQTQKEEKEESENWYRLERESGMFRRTFDLPTEVDEERIIATEAHGSLLIVIPKRPGEPKKKVKVESGERQRAAG